MFGSEQLYWESETHMNDSGQLWIIGFSYKYIFILVRLEQDASNINSGLEINIFSFLSRNKQERENKMLKVLFYDKKFYL